MNASRESIYAALFALFTPLLGTEDTPGPFVTISRKWVPFSECDRTQQPALYQMQDDQTSDQKQAMGLPRWTLRAQLYLYSSPDQASDVIPSTQLNNLLDAVEGALMPQFAGEKQTLGGLVQNCWIDGKITIIEGVLGQQAVAVIPISMLTGI